MRKIVLLLILLAIFVVMFTQFASADQGKFYGHTAKQWTAIFQSYGLSYDKARAVTTRLISDKNARSSMALLYYTNQNELDMKAKVYDKDTVLAYPNNTGMSIYNAEVVAAIETVVDQFPETGFYPK